MTGSHTSTSARHTGGSGRRLDGPDRHLKLVSTGEHGLPAELPDKVDGHRATIAEHMREGLLAASTAVGLEVTCPKPSGH